MDAPVYLNTRLLRDHVSRIQEERRTAQRLYESVRRAKELSDPTIESAYNGVLDDINALIRYFEKMEDAFDQIELKAIELNRTVQSLVQEGIDQTKEVQNKYFF